MDHIGCEGIPCHGRSVTGMPVRNPSTTKRTGPDIRMSRLGRPVAFLNAYTYSEVMSELRTVGAVQSCKLRSRRGRAALCETAVSCDRVSRGLRYVPCNSRRVRDPKCKWENANQPRRTSKKPAPTRLIECRARPGSPQRGRRHTRVPAPSRIGGPCGGYCGLFSPTRKGYFQYRDLMQVRADVSLADEFSRVAARWR